MKKVYKICFCLIPLICLEAHSLSDQDKLLKQRYTDNVNHVESQNPVPIFSSGPGYERKFSLIERASVRSSESENMSYSPVPQKLSVEQISLRPQSEEEKNFAAYFDEHNFAKNPTLTFEGYSSVLGNNAHLEKNFYLSSEHPCVLDDNDILNSDNIEVLSDPIENIKKQHQFCGFEEGHTLGLMGPSIDFCRCVRSKTQENKNREGLYKEFVNTSKFNKLKDIYRQKVVEKVMPDLLRDIEDMTEASNDFLSTDELSHMLYEVKTSEDVKNKNARSLLERTRQTMHSCSGLGLANMIEDLFNPKDQDHADCDENSAEILLNGFISSMKCESSNECPNYDELAKSELYRGKEAYSALSDFLTYKFSQDFITEKNLDEERSARGTNKEDFYSKSLMHAKAMTDFDLDGVPFVNLDMVKLERRLPSKEQLKLLYSLMESENDRLDNFNELKEDEKELVSELIAVLAKNSLYNNAGHFLNADKKFSNNEKLAFLKNFAQTLKSDMKRRIKKLPSSQKYFNESSDPVERMEKIIINNYLYLGDEVAKDCTETKRKLKKLCTSISGDGMALFSHPDYRDKTAELLLDSELQSEIARIADDEVDGRSPTADQLFCHANFSSLSADCIEDANLKTRNPHSPIHCDYRGEWLLPEVFSNLNLNPIGNIQSTSHDLIQKVTQDSYSASSEDDFGSVVKSKPTEIYKSEGRELKNIVRAQNNNKPKFSQNLIGNQKANISKQKDEIKAKTLTPTSPLEVKNNPQQNDGGKVKTRSFSDNFRRRPSSVKPQIIDRATSSVDQGDSERGHKKRTASSSQKEDMDKEKLINELRLAKERQEALEAQLDKLSTQVQLEEDQEHKAKVKEKEDKLESLQAEIKQLQTKVQSEKNKSSTGKRNDGSQYRPTSPESLSNINTASGPTSSVREDRSNSPWGGMAQAKTQTTNTSVDALRGPEVKTAKTQSRTPASRSPDGPLVLRSVDSNQLLPSTVDLGSVASTLKEEKYILLDIGNPVLAEKVVFKADMDGRILFDESGEPIIESREIVKLEDELAEKKIDQAEEPESQVGEVQDSKSYRWSEVEELLDLNTNGLPIQ